MKIHYLQHVPFEGLGSIEQWAINQGHQLSVTRLYAGDPLPVLDSFDMLIIMGGPMSINDEFEHVWLKAEKWFVKQVIAADKPILGICLGAQLLAETLGGSVHPGKEKEIGWFPITFDKAFVSSELGQRFPETINVFHWHGETFSLPADAHPIASSEACNNQGFIYNKKFIGLQFHLEMTALSAENIISHSTHELVPAPYIQSEEELLGDSIRFTETNKFMQIFMEYLTEQVRRQNDT